MPVHCSTAWRRRGEVPDNSLPWLYGVARRLLANEWRTRRSAPTLLPMTEAHEPEVPEPDASLDVADLLAALARIPEPDQEILRLVGWEELTVSEAAGGGPHTRHVDFDGCIVHCAPIGHQIAAGHSAPALHAQGTKVPAVEVANSSKILRRQATSTGARSVSPARGEGA